MDTHFSAVKDPIGKRVTTLCRSRASVTLCTCRQQREEMSWELRLEWSGAHARRHPRPSTDHRIAVGHALEYPLQLLLGGAQHLVSINPLVSDRSLHLAELPEDRMVQF